MITFSSGFSVTINKIHNASKRKIKGPQTFLIQLLHSTWCTFVKNYKIINFAEKQYINTIENNEF